MSRFNGILLAIGMLLSAPLQAHLLKVFAFADGNRIDGSVYFAGGAPAAGAKISVQTAGGRLLAELTPDAEGGFSYVATANADHIIKASTGDGHVAGWTLTAEELTGKGTASDTESGAPANPAPIAGQERPQITNDELAALVERAVARQVRPLREELIAYEERVRLRDVIGGIGYIVGLAGLTAWWHKRRRSDK